MVAGGGADVTGGGGVGEEARDEGQGHCPQRAMQPFSRSSRNAGVAKTKGRQKSAIERGDIIVCFILKEPW